jgi:NHL repeat
LLQTVDTGKTLETQYAGGNGDLLQFTKVQMLYQVITKLSVAIGLSVTLATCGGGGGTPATSSGTTPATPTYSVGGIVSGLRAGLSVVLQDSSGASASLSANGSYTLLASATAGTAYSLSVKTQPLGQVCNLSNASGSVAGANIGNVALSCANALSLLAGSISGPGHVDGTGGDASFDSPTDVATDSAGNVFVADARNHTIRKITTAGVVSTLAGTAGAAGATNGTGSAALFNGPNGIATDSEGNVFVADSGNHTIRKITSAGVVSTLAGMAGVDDTYADSASDAFFSYPTKLTVDGAGNVLVTNVSNKAVRKITPEGVVSTLTSRYTALCDVHTYGASIACFEGAKGIVADAVGNVFVADVLRHNILKITPAGVVGIFAGRDSPGSENGTVSTARFFAPVGLAMDSAGNMFVAEYGSATIRKITPAGEVSTLAGLAYSPGSADGTGSAARFYAPTGLATDRAGHVFVADSGNNTIRKITPAGVVSTIAGTVAVTGSADGTGRAAGFNGLQGIATDNAGNVLVADTDNQTIRKITPAGVVSTVAGKVGVTGATNGSGSTALFYNPRGIATDSAGNVFVAEIYRNAIRKITPSGEVSDVWGSAGVVSGYSGGAPPTHTGPYIGPHGLATDGAGNVFVASTFNHTILKFTPAGVVSTFAGSPDRHGTAEGTGSEASFYLPNCIATDGNDNVFVADGDGTIRKITQAGVVTILAGTPFVYGMTDGTGSAASFGAPKSLATDNAGNVFVADPSSHTIRKITPAGVVSTVVGKVGLAGISLSALPGGLTNPYGVAVFGDKLFISSSNAVLWTYLP